MSLRHPVREHVENVTGRAVCCSEQCGAVCCCSVLQRVAVCCSVLQYDAMSQFERTKRTVI